MYKYFNNNDKEKKMKCCPMGTYRGGNVVECYHFGLVTLKECGKCDVRKDNTIVKKGE